MSYPTKKLGEVCDIYQPQTITSNEILKEGPYKVFGANGVIGYYTKYNHEDAEVLVTCRGATCGTLNMSEPKSWITGNAMVVHSKDENVLLKSFLYYTLKNSNLLKTITGTGQPQITRNSLAPLQILLPPLDTQKQIVERLDKIAKAQKLNDALIQKTDELFQSLLHKELNPAGKNWEVKKLGELVAFLDNQRKPISEVERQRRIGPYPYYGANGQVGWIDDYLFDEDLVLLAEDGGYFGSKDRPIAYRISGKTWVNNHAHVLRVNKKVAEIGFIHFRLMFYDVRPYITGSTRTKLNKSAAEKIKVPLPPLNVQKQIATKLSAVQEYKTQLLEQKKKLKELFNSSLHKSFKNE